MRQVVILDLWIFTIQLLGFFDPDSDFGELVILSEIETKIGKAQRLHRASQPPGLIAF